MARRRNQKNPIEALFGIFIFIVAIFVINPKFRQQMSSLFATILAFTVIVGIIGLAIYLIIQVKKSKEKPLPSPIRRSPSNQQPNNIKTGIPAYNEGPRLDFKVNTERGPELTDEQLAANGTGYDFLYSPPAPQKPQQWDDTILKIIEWRRFEIVTKEFLNMAGFVASETKTGADGGVDILVHKKDNPESKGIVQCKSWNTYKVGIKVVRELFGIMAADRISMGMVITSGVFTSEAEEFAAGKMKLVDGRGFLEHIRKLPAEKQQHLLDIALEGDYTTPTCPQCDVKLKLRESSKGRNAGGKFWGCVNYPRCRQTLVYKAD